MLNVKTNNIRPSEKRGWCAPAESESFLFVFFYFILSFESWLWVCTWARFDVCLVFSCEKKKSFMAQSENGISVAQKLFVFVSP